MSVLLSKLTVTQLFVLVSVLYRTNVVRAIPASIKPLDPIVEAGSNVTFRCVLNTSATTQSATDIVWYFKSYSNRIPRDQYEVEDNISRIKLHNVTFSDSGSYFCAFESDGRRMLLYQGSLMHVGVAPSPPKGLRCHSPNMFDFWCEWNKVANTNLRTRYKFSYRNRYGPNDWKDCPKMEGRGRNTCVVSRHHNNGFGQLIRVTATNNLGSATSEIYYNPGFQAVPNPPTAVTTGTLSPEEVHITWNLPQEWDGDYANYLEYRLEITTTGNGAPVRMIPDLEHGGSYLEERQYTVGNLLPHTPYTARVSCRSMGSFTDEYWSDWSEPVTQKTAEAVPNMAPTDIQAQEYDNSEDLAYKRDVFLQWQALPRPNRRGRILGYDVILRQMLSNGSSSLDRSVRVNGTMVLLESLDKFHEYYVDIAACNAIGQGPVASYFLADKTSEPGAPKDVRVQNLTETSVLVTWQRPSRPNGYIDGYYVQWTKGAAGDTTSNFVEVNTTTMSHIVTGLEPDRLYQFWVKTKNSRGYSGWSNAPIQHTGNGSRMEFVRSLIGVLYHLLTDNGGPDAGQSNQISLDAISTSL